MSKVFFFDYSKGKGLLSGIRNLCGESGILEMIPGDSSVAVKLHMGELGNRTYIRPVFVHRVVDLVKKAGGKPFVTDTTAMYPGGRDTAGKYLSTAAYNGFTESSLGAPVVIADGDGYNGVPVALKNTVNGCELQEVEIATGIYESSFLLVLSHMKGHMLAGFGGGLKNLAMGCVTKKSKNEQHKSNPPLFEESKCDGCEACIEACPVEALTSKDGKPERDPEKCMYCGVCISECPCGALYLGSYNKKQFQIYLAHAASAVFHRFEGKIGFINFVQDVTPHCDCTASSGQPVVPDIGILASLDPVAIDKASMDLVDQSSVICNEESLSPPDILGKLHNVDSLGQLITAQELGLGSMEYELITL